MSETPIRGPVQDRWLYAQNRAKFKPEDLAPYGGQWVAWSLDGSRVVAHHANLEQLEREIELLGLTFEEVIFDSIPSGGIVETML